MTRSSPEAGAETLELKRHPGPEIAQKRELNLGLKFLSLCSDWLPDTSYSPWLERGVPSEGGSGNISTPDIPDHCNRLEHLYT